MQQLERKHKDVILSYSYCITSQRSLCINKQ